MLKIILSVTGVVFIGLGLFGGPLLENFTKQSSDQMAVVEVPATTPATNNTNANVNANINVNEENSMEVASNLPATNTTQTPAAETVATVSATQQATPAASLEPKAAAPVVVTSVPAASVSVASAAASTPDASVVAKADDEELIIDATTGEVAEPIAPAQAAGDLIAMAEQAKSSSRNEQVELAATVLTAAKQPEATAPVTKAAEVQTALASTTGELNNEILVVIKDKVNLRDGPSIDHPIVLQLQQGQELMEFKREGKWVHVGAYGTSGKIGWVHQRLVSGGN